MATIKVDIELDPTQAQAAARKIGDALQSAIDIKRTPGAILESLSIDEFNRILGIVRQIEATQEKIKAATGATDAEVRSVVSYRQKELDLTIKTLTEQKKILDATRAQTAEKQKQSTIPTMSGRSALFNQAQFQQRSSSITALRPVLDLRQDPSWEFTRKASQIALDLAKQRQSILKSNSRAYFEEYNITLNTLNALRQGVQFRVRERTELEKTLATQRAITSQIDQQKTKSGQVPGRIRPGGLGDEGAGALLADALTSTGRRIASTGSSLSFGVTVPLTAVATAATKAALDIDKTRSSLIGLTGSTDQANKKLEILRDLSQSSVGVTLDFAATLYTQFQALGTVTEDTTFRLIRSLGRLNAVFTLENPQRFAQNLRQIFQQGFEIQDIKEAVGQVGIFEQILETAFGTRDQKKLRDLKKSGELTLSTFLEGITSAIDRLLPNVQESLGSQITKLFDSYKIAIEPLGKAILESFLPVLKSLVPVIIDISKAFSSLPPNMQEFIVFTGAATLALGPFLRVIGDITAGIGGLIRLLTLETGAIAGIAKLTAIISGPGGLSAAFLSLNPVVLGIGALLTAGLITWYEYGTAVERASQQIDQAVQRQRALVEGPTFFDLKGNPVTARGNPLRPDLSFQVPAVPTPLVSNVPQVSQVGRVLENAFGIKGPAGVGFREPAGLVKQGINLGPLVPGTRIKLSKLPVAPPKGPVVLDDEDRRTAKQASDAQRQLLAEQSALLDARRNLIESELDLEDSRLRRVREVFERESKIQRERIENAKSFITLSDGTLAETKASIDRRNAFEAQNLLDQQRITENEKDLLSRRAKAITDQINELKANLPQQGSAVDSARLSAETLKTQIEINNLTQQLEKVQNDASDLDKQITEINQKLLLLRIQTGPTNFVGPQVFQDQLNRRFPTPPPPRDAEDILAEKSAEIRRQILQIDREINRGAVNEADTRKQINDLLRQEAEFKIQIKIAELERTDSPSRRAAILEQIEELKNVGIELTNTERFMRGFRSSIESTGDAFDRLGQNISRSLQNVQGLLGNLKKSFLQFFNDILGAGLQRFFAEILGPILGVTGQRRGASAGGGVTGAVGAATGALFGGGGGSGGGILGALFGGGGSGGGSGVGGFRTPPFVPGGVAVGAGVGGLGAILGGLGVAGGALTIAEALKRGQGPQLNGIPGIFDSGMPALGGGVLKTGGPISVLKEIFKGNAFKGFGRNLPVGSARGPLASIAPLLGAQLGIGLGGRSKLGQVLGGIGGAALGIGITAAPAILGVGGAVAGILGAKLTAALAGLFSNPVTAVIGGALLVGSLLLGRSQQRRSDEEQSGIYLQDAVSQMMALKERVKAGGASVEETRKAGEQIIQTFISQINTIKTKSVRESRLTNQVRDLRNILESQVIPAVASGQKRSSTESRLIPEFNMGGMVPGIDKGYDSILARVRPGEMILNRDQQKSIRQSLGYNVFAMAGVPNVAAGGFAAPGGNLMRGTDDGPLMIELNVGLGISDRDATRIVAAAGTTSNGRRVIVSSVRRGQKK